MAENQKSKPEKQLGGKTPGGTLASEETMSFQKAVNEALKAYIQQLAEVYNNQQKKSAELYQEYLKAQNEQQVLTYDSLKEDYRNYVGTLRETLGQENAQIKYDQSNKDYVNILNDRQTELNKNLENLYVNYLEVLEKNVTQTMEEYRKEYQNYLRTIQEAWQKVDITTLDVNTLASLGQVLITASHYAGNTIAAK